MKAGKCAGKPAEKLTIKALDSRLSSLEEKTKVLSERTQCFLQAEKKINSIKTDCGRMSSKLQVEITRATVVSEVAHLWPELGLSAIKLLDKDDAWWRDRKNLVLHEWRDLIVSMESKKALKAV